MKSLLILIFSVSTLTLNAQNLVSYRDLMKKGVESETATKTLVENSKKAFESTKKPIFEAFYAMGNLLLAKHAGNPMKRFSYFRKGKSALDNAAKTDPKNVEIRFLRYVTQQQAPAFLGYNKDMKADKELILREYKNLEDKDLVQRIIRHFKIG